MSEQAARHWPGDDVAATARAVAAAGGAVLEAPEKAPGGKRAIVDEPFGARMALIARG